MGAALCAALTVLCCIPVVAEAVEVSATACVLMDADSGRVLYEKNGRQRMLIASTTKLMTALVALEQGTLTDVVTVTASHMAEGSSMYLRAGEKLTLEELLYGLLLCSGNDAALAVTECAGGLEPFVALMNEKAAALGMADTHFANPNGLDGEEHYSTEGCLGLKTGYTKAAGRTLVSCAEKDGRRLVAVTLRDGDDWNDHEALYRWGFMLTGAENELRARLLRAAENVGKR